MNPVVAALAVGALTTFGKWSRGKTLDINTVVGVTVLAVSLAIIDQMNRDLAKAFGALAVVSVAVAHSGAIFDAANPGKERKSGGGGGSGRERMH